jgi:hypothetical protein
VDLGHFEERRNQKMKKASILTGLFILAILFSAWTPVQASAASGSTAAGDIPLVITNPLPKGVTVTIKNKNTSLTYYIPTGGLRTKTLPKGKYRYQYQGCLDKKYSGVLPYKNGQYVLDIKLCKMIELTIYNPFFDTYRSTMQGWVNYEINLKPKQYKTFEVAAGNYYLKYTCTPSNNNWEGKIRLKKDRFWVMCG